MQNEYVFSFLSSPVNPRTDTKIAQLFTLGYLNSEPGSNYIFRYKPYTSAASRIDMLDTVFADKSRKREAHHKRFGDYFDRRIHHTGERIEKREWGIKQSLEALSSHGFFGVLEESISTIHAIQYFERIHEEARHIDREQNPLRTMQFVEEQLESLIHPHQKKGIRRLSIRDTLVGMYQNFYERNDRKDTKVENVLKVNRVNLSKEVVDVSQYVNAAFERLRDGVSLEDFFGDRIHQRRENTLVYEKSIISDLALLPTQVIQYEVADRPDQIGHKAKGITIGHPEEKDMNYVYPYPLIANKEENHATKGRYLNADGDDKESLFTQLHLAETTGEQGVKYDISLLLDKATDGNKDARIYEDLRYVWIENPTATIYDDFIYARNNENWHARHYMHMRQVEHYDEAGSMIIHAMHFYDRGQSQSVISRDNKWTDEKMEKLSKDSLAYQLPSIMERTGDSGHVLTIPRLVDMQPKESHNLAVGILLTDGMEQHARVDIHDTVTDTKVLKDTKSSAVDQSIILVDSHSDNIKAARIESMHVFVDKMNRESRPVDTQPIFVDKMNRDIRLTTALPIYVDKLERDSSLANYHYRMLDDKVAKDMRYDFLDQKLELAPLNAYIASDVSIKVEKIKKETWIVYVLSTLDAVAKATLIVNNMNLFNKVVQDSYVFEAGVQYEYLNKSAKESVGYDYRFGSTKNEKDMAKIDMLLADTGKLDGYFRDMLYSAVGDDNLNALIQKHKLAPEPERYALVPNELKQAKDKDSIAIIQEAFMAKEQEYRDALIPEQQYVTAGDLSEWEDIWSRYWPGIDVLDVPNSDYDYSKLSSQVYDEKTGVPYRPLSPLNKPDVKVKTPLHHPIPEFANEGTQNWLPVDNYVMIDVILAIESLKNRSKLKYAGMPAERALQDLLSKLWTWIHQAAPDNEEYQRMFRMARWYMEMAILKVSDHILHREYTPFVSTLHKEKDLGIPYHALGWRYYPTSHSLETVSPNAKLTFTNENYVDSHFKLRGYFDNPQEEGTMVIKVDGVIIDIINSRGVIEKEYELPMGKHTFEFILTSEKGSFAISSLEIGGSVFVRAWTTADDTNTNGLKAATVLIEQLLVYYEQHHGGNKKKGNMVIKQRMLWQST